MRSCATVNERPCGDQPVWDRNCDPELGVAGVSPGIWAAHQGLGTGAGTGKADSVAGLHPFPHGSPGHGGGRGGRENLHPRAPRRVAQVLPPGGRLSFLTIQGGSYFPGNSRLHRHRHDERHRGRHLRDVIDLGDFNVGSRVLVGREVEAHLGPRSLAYRIRTLPDDPTAFAGRSSLAGHGVEATRFFADGPIPEVPTIEIGRITVVVPGVAAV